jgi:thiamine biosynthesis lipoprotein
MPRKTTRRDFLRGKSAADAVGDLGRRSADDAALAGDSAAGRTAEKHFLVQISRRAMACEFVVMLNARQYAHGPQAAVEALDLVDRLEEQMSVFRQTSEVAKINRSAAEAPVPVEPRLFELLQLAVRLHAETEGAFDITAGPLWRVWGFARRQGTIPTDEQLEEALARVGTQRMQLDPQRQTIRFRQPGVELNLGSIGKGYALDRCAELLQGAGVNDFLIHGGLSSVLARGSAGQTYQNLPGGEPAGWIVSVPHPWARGRAVAEIRLRDRTLATSGTRKQFFRHRGRRYGHILDPRTGRPAEGIYSATVISADAATADALSTAFYVMGVEKAMEFCKKRPGLATVLVCPGKHRGSVAVHSANLAAEELRLLERETQN